MSSPTESITSDLNELPDITLQELNNDLVTAPSPLQVEDPMKEAFLNALNDVLCKYTTPWLDYYTLPPSEDHPRPPKIAGHLYKKLEVR